MDATGLDPWLCPKCKWRQLSDTGDCVQCGHTKPMPKPPVAKPPEAGADQICFLLAEVQGWVASGLLAQEAADRITPKYQARLGQIKQQQRVEELVASAVQALNAGHPEEALRQCDEALHISPDALPAVRLKASALERLGRVAAAAECHQFVVSRDPNDAQSSVALQRLRAGPEEQFAHGSEDEALARISQIGDPPQVVAAARLLTAARTLSLQGHVRLATMLERVGALDEATIHLRAADHIQPGVTEVIAGFARLSAARRAEVHHEEKRPPRVTVVHEEPKRPPSPPLWDRLVSALSAFMAQRNIQWMHLVGAVVLLAGVFGVAAWAVTVQRLWGVVGRAVALVVPLLAAVGLYWAARALLASLRVTALCFQGLASALLAVTLAFAKALYPAFMAWSWGQHGLIVSATCTVAYIAVLALDRTPMMMLFAGAGALAAAHYALAPACGIGSGPYGLCFAAAGLAYIVASHVLRRRSAEPLAAPLEAMGHLTMAVALGSTLIRGHWSSAEGPGTGPAHTMLVVALAYGLVAYLFQHARYLPVSCAAFLGLVVVGLRGAGIAVEQWHTYALGFAVVGSAFVGMEPASAARGQDSFGTHYRWFGMVATAGVLLIVFGKTVVAALALTTPVSPAEAPYTIAAAALIGAAYAASSLLSNRPVLVYGSAACWTYAVIVLALYLQRPAAELPLWVMAPALLLVVAGWALRSPDRVEHAVASRRAGYILAAVCAIAALGLWASARGDDAATARNAAWWVLLLSAALYATTARTTSRAAWLYASGAAAALWWLCGITELLDRGLADTWPAANHGLLFTPFVVALLAVSSVLRKRSHPEHAQAIEHVCMVVAICAAASQLALLSHPFGARPDVEVALLLYACLFGAQAALQRAGTLPSGVLRASTVHASMALACLWVAAFRAAAATAMSAEQTVIVTLLVGGIAQSFAAGRAWKLGDQPFAVPLAMSASGAVGWAIGAWLLPDVAPGVMLGTGLAVLGPVLSRGDGSGSNTDRVTAAHGVLLLAVCAHVSVAAVGLPGQALPIVACIVGASAFAFARRAADARPSAYLMVAGLLEAAFLVARGLTPHAPPCIVYGLTPVALGAVLLAAAWALQRRGDALATEAAALLAHAAVAAGVAVALTREILGYDGALPPAATIAAVGIAACVHGFSAVIFRRPGFVYASALLLAACHLLAGMRWVWPHVAIEHGNPGLWALPIIAAIVLTGHWLSRRKQPDYAWPCHTTAGLLAIPALAGQPIYSPETASAALFGYGALAGWASWVCVQWAGDAVSSVLRRALGHVSLALLALGWLTGWAALGRHAQSADLHRSLGALTLQGWCLVAALGGAWLARRDRAWRDIPIVSACVWSLVALGWSAVPEGAPIWASLASASLSMVVLSLCSATLRLREIGLVGAAVFALAWAWVWTARGVRMQPSGTQDLVLCGLAAVAACASACGLARAFRSVWFAGVAVVASWCGFVAFLDAGLAGVVEARTGWLGAGHAVYAVALIAAAKLLRRRGSDHLVAAPMLGSAIAALVAADLAIPYAAGLAATPLWAPMAAAAAAFAATSVMYRVEARRASGDVFSYLSAGAAVTGYLEGASVLRSAAGAPDPFHYAALYALPLLAALAVMGMRKDSERGVGEPYVASALALSLPALINGSIVTWSEPPVTAWAFAAYGAAYALAAWRLRLPWVVYAATASLSVSWYCWGRALLPHHAIIVEQSVSLAALGLLWLAAYIVLDRAAPDRAYADAPYRFSVALTAVGGIGAWAGAMHYGDGYTLAAVALGMAAVTHLALAVRRHSTPLLATGNVAFLLGWHAGYEALGLAAGDAIPPLCAWMSALGLAQTAAGLLRLHQHEGSAAGQLQLALGIGVAATTSLAALGTAPLQRQYGEWAVGALLIGATAQMAAAVGRRNVACLHAGLAGVLAALYLVLYGKLNLPVDRMLDLYAAPIGLYLLAIPLASGCIGRPVKAGPYQTAGLGVLLGAGCLSTLAHGWQSWHSHALLIESVAALLYGLSRRLKVYFLFGTAFTGLWSAMLVHDAAVRQMHAGTLVAGVFGILVGGGLIVFASRSEQQRMALVEDVRRRIDDVLGWE